MKTFTKLAIVWTILLTTSLGFASRIEEIEDYYYTRVNKILNARFPDKPFTVIVELEAGNKDLNRKEAAETPTTTLPYWEEAENTLDIWDRTDVPLSSLIAELKSVSLKVKVDASLTDTEIKDLQKTIATQLRLDERADSIEISRLDWDDPEKYRSIKWIGGFLAIAIIGLLTMFWILAKISVSQLIQGLSSPIKEIGKSTKDFANSALNAASTPGSSVSGDLAKKSSGFEDDFGGMDMSANLLEIRQNALELIQRNSELFSHPDAHFMDFIEQTGSSNPVQMGSILVELEKNILKNLYLYGKDDWWLVAIAQSAPISAKTLALLGRIDRYRVRRQFSGTNTHLQDQKLKEFALTIARLDVQEIVQLFENQKFEKVAPILDGLPRDLSLAVAKKLYPGHWALYFEGSLKYEKMDEAWLEKIREKALEIKPLKDENEILNFFKDLDLVNYLDLASPQDEEDFYKVISNESRIKKERYPFYEVFNAEPEVIKVLGMKFSPQDWAVLLNQCDAFYRDKFIMAFAERLQFQVRENLHAIKGSEADETVTKHLRRSLVEAYTEEKHRYSMKKRLENFEEENQQQENDNQEDSTDEEAPAA